MKISSSFELFAFLHSLDLLRDSPSWWWRNSGELEVIVGVILTQNTRWENVQKSLQNLYRHGLLSIHEDEKNLRSIAMCYAQELALLIAPSGFANQKSQRLKLLAQNILNVFGDYQTFLYQVDGDWLIAQKGIGQESRDSILNYACQREVMVVDRYTHKLLCSCGYEMQGYDEIQEWMSLGIVQNLDEVAKLYPFEISLAQIYARFHGKIVEFSKRRLKIQDFEQLIGRS